MATASTTLNDLLDPVGECLTPKAARQLVNLRASPKAQERIDELATKSNEGTLSKEEQAEYDVCVSAGTFIAILQSKARKFLQHHPNV